MRLNFLTAALFCFSAAAGSANAASVITSTDSSATASTTGLTTFTTMGDDMVGMIISAEFLDGTSQSLTWSAWGDGSGGVGSALFSLAIAGDTYFDNWVLRNNSLSAMTKLTINAIAGDTVFDIWRDPTIGTANSAHGEPFRKTSGMLPGTLQATYSTAVALTGSTPVGDLFGFLTLDFSGLTGRGLASGTRMTFLADTDNLLAREVAPVPVPGALPLFAAALGGMGLYVRRRRGQAAIA